MKNDKIGMWLLLIFCIPLAQPALYSELVDSSVPWQFLQRFCFTPTPSSVPDSTDPAQLRDFGLLFYTIYYKVGDKPSLMLYYDGFDSWDEVKHSNLTCAERRSFATTEIKLWEYSPLLVESERNDVINFNIKISGYVLFRAAVPTYFFVAGANCQPADLCRSSFCEGPLQMQYTFFFTNGKSLFTKQFSWDDQGILELRIVFLVLYVISGIFCIVIGHILALKNKLHHTVRLLFYSIFLQLLGQIAHLLHLGKYSVNGVGILAFQLAGYVIEIISEMITVLLLILMAKGWTIYRRKITASGRAKIAVYMTVFVAVSVVTRAWAVYYFDPSTITFYYESPPGKFLIALRFLMWVWFLYANYTTFKDSKRKRGFYIKFCTLFGIWFLVIPLMLIASIRVSNAIRSKFAVAWELLLAFAAHVALLALYNPSTRCNRSFPFHANTSEMLGLIEKKMAQASKLAVKQISFNAASQNGHILPPTSNPQNQDPFGLNTQNQDAFAVNTQPANGNSFVPAPEPEKDVFEETARLLGSKDPFFMLQASGRNFVKDANMLKKVAADMENILTDMQQEDEDLDLDEPH